MRAREEHFSILFVCLGNICRSPLGEGICVAKIQERGLVNHFEVDSCGTGNWHVGAPPHRESQRVAKMHGIDISSQRARELSLDDGETFSLLIAMDRSNKQNMLNLLGSEARIQCLREFDSEDSTSLDVPDPYHGGVDGFQEVYDIIDRSVERLLDSLCEELGF